MADLADGRAHRPIHQLVRMARDELARIDTQIRWLTALQDGQTSTENAGTSSNIAADPTHAAHAASTQPRRRIRQAHAQLAWLVDHKLPAIARALELDAVDPRYSERPLLSDEERGASIDGGLSAYRGDQRAPRGRPDLAEAIAAQQRRIHRGQGYGHG